MAVRDISIVFTGTRSAEAMAAGTILLRGAALAGYYGQISMVYGPEIPGGENAALVQLSAGPVQGQSDRYDVVCLIDWDDLGKFAGRIPTSVDGLVIYDPAECALPPTITGSPVRKVAAGFRELSATIFEGRPYVAAAGFVAGLLGLPFEAVDRAAEAEVADKGAYTVATCKAVVRLGFQYGGAKQPEYQSGVTLREVERRTLTGAQSLEPDSAEEGINLGRRIPALVDGSAPAWKEDPKPRKGK